MENCVKDSIITTTDDETLSLLLEVVIDSINTNRPLFPNPLDEPTFYRRYFLRWVREGLEEAKKIKEVQNRS